MNLGGPAPRLGEGQASAVRPPAHSAAVDPQPMSNDPLANALAAAVEGKLILLGEIRPMRLEITRFKCGLNLAVGKRGCGADAQGTLHRSEFGMQTGIPFIGDEVRLRIQVEAYPPP